MAAKKKKTYRKPRARRYFYRSKKGIYTSKGLKARFVRPIRVMVLNNMQGAGEGYHWFNFGAQTVIEHMDYNIWSNCLKADTDFLALSNQYSMFKIYGISVQSIPSPMNVNAIDNRRDCTAYIKCQPVRQAVDYNTRFMLLNPLSDSKMYWKVGSYTQWCYTNPSAEQEQTDNKNLVILKLVGNSGVQPYQNCPVWTVRLCVYVRFRARQSD